MRFTNSTTLTLARAMLLINLNFVNAVNLLHMHGERHNYLLYITAMAEMDKFRPTLKGGPPCTHLAHSYRQTCVDSASVRAWGRVRETWTEHPEEQTF